MSETVTFEAIGTQFWIEIFDEISEQKLEATKGRLELLSSEFNQQYSRFLPDSDISILNRDRVLHNPSEECRALLILGKQLYLRTEGTLNILVGHIVEARGYDATYSFVPSEALPELKMGNPVTDLIISDETISLLAGNIDVGGYGKGYLIDRLADDLKAQGLEFFLVNGGGDMYGTSNHGEPIIIYLEHPTEPQTYLQETTLMNQGFAASSPFKREWKSGDTTYSHIVTDGDVPKLASFAKAATAVEADAFATACLLLPEAHLPELAAREGCAFARFNPASGQLWQTQYFNT